MLPHLPPIPLTRAEPQLIVTGASGQEIVWFEAAGVALRLDPIDGHIVDRQPVPTDSLGSYTIRSSPSPPRTVTVTYAGGSFELPRVRGWALASSAPGADLLLAASEQLIRVHPSGVQEVINAPAIHHVAGLPDGVAYTHGDHRASGRVAGLVVHGAGSACFLDGPDGPIVAPLRAGDPMILRDRERTLLVGSDCAVLAALPVHAQAATLSSEALWLLTDRALLRYPRHADAFGPPRSVAVAGPTGAVDCGDPCLTLGPLIWNPFSGERSVRGVGAPPRQPASAFTLVGGGDGTFRLRAVPGGTRVINTVTGHDVGVEIPRWARHGVVSADGRLALIVSDDPAPTTALFEVATGRERWSVPSGSNPMLLTSRGAVLNPPDPVLIDTATGRSALKLVRGDSGRDAWLDGNLVVVPGDWWATKPAADAPIVATLHATGGGEALRAPRWPEVVAPEPADAGPADDPLARAIASRGTQDAPPVPLDGLPHLLAAERARSARILELAEVLRVLALRGHGDWPPSSVKTVDVAVKRRSLPPGRLVGGVTGLTLHNNPVTLPLRPGRPVLVVIGTDGQLPDRLLSAARDPAIDVLWALGDDDPYGLELGGALERLVGESGGGLVLPGLIGLLSEHDPGQTVEVGGFGEELARHLGLPLPGAMLVDADGHVLAEGNIETVADAMRWRNLEGVRVAKPTPWEWRYEGPEPVRTVAALADDGVAFRTDRTVGVLTGDGRLRWDVALVGKQVHVAGDLVLVSDGRRVVALNAVDGVERWTADGSVVAVGATFAWVAERSYGRILSLTTGESSIQLRGIVHPDGVGDVLWFDGPEEWRCGVTPSGAPVKCGYGDRFGSTVLSWDPPELTAVSDEGRELWTTTVAVWRIQGTHLLACLGSASGPWVELDARGRPVAVLLSDAPVETNPSPSGLRRLYGTERGAVVAWRAK